MDCYEVTAAMKAKIDAVEAQLRTTEVQTAEKIQEAVGFDPNPALRLLFKQGRAAETRAGGMVFWSEAPKRPTPQELGFDEDPGTSFGRTSLKKTHRVEGSNFVD